MREIWLYLPSSCHLDQFESVLQSLLDDSLIFKVGDFYSLQNESTTCERRVKGNERATGLLLTARKVANFLSKFPFVKGVAVSGSLSKHFADELSDIDLFIITASNRLWIARSILHLFKKLTFLANRQHYFCMNYFIDEAHLEIIEKNIYTATEIVTLMPLQGSQSFVRFFAANTWTKEFLPNNIMRVSISQDIPLSFLKKILEIGLNFLGGNKLDTFLMKITAGRWESKKRKGRLNQNGLLMSMDATKHVAKPDPKQFQHSLLELYLAKAGEYEMILHNGILINPVVWE